MIHLLLDRFDFVSAVEGFARGSHLRQHVWKQIVYPSIPQMSLDEMDFLWYFFRRDLWSNYFYNAKGRIVPVIGHKDYLHTLAALHRGNRYLVTCKTSKVGGLLSAVCYRFNGEYYALYARTDEDFQSLFVRCVTKEQQILGIKRNTFSVIIPSFRRIGFRRLTAGRFWKTVMC